jgi:predicted alpha-1,2-mannosidase
MFYQKKIATGIAGSMLLLAAAGMATAQTPVSYVDPYIGTGSHGHVFLGASVPFGAVQVGPNNFYKGWDWCSGYNYGDSVLIGFSQLHLSGTGIGDLADVLVMPYTGAVKTDKGTEQQRGSGYASRYSHRSEKARPGYYAVQLSDYNVEVELTASARVAFHQYRFPAGKEAHVIIDLKEGINDQSRDTYLEQVDEYTFKGYRFSKGWAKDQWQFFAIKSAVPIRQFALYDDNKKLEGKSAKAKALKGLISFDQGPALLQLKIGLSPVSAENALANITAEIPHWNFNAIAQQATSLWNKELSKITIQAKNEADKRIFYTALYHTMINPSLFNDANGEFRGADKKVYSKPGFNNYSVFSTWDTYRATHPLYTLLQPDRVNDMVKTMLGIYSQQGRLPIWHLMGNETGTMVGISSLQIIAEAYMKGIRNYDVNAVYEAVKATAMGDSLGLLYLKQNKPIAADIQRRSVAKALEYAIGDGSIALMAAQLGKTADAQYFLNRSRAYKLYYDQATGFFRGRLANGNWNPNFDPLKSTQPWGEDFAEGNSWQYLWLVPQDVKGLMNLLGGQQIFVKRLDSLFTLQSSETDSHTLADLTGLIGQYAHGNEPSHHITYLYAYAGQQWKTAEKVRYILKEMYQDAPAGIIGNEDCGQMSAWYIFSALGFYPVFPASGNYVIGSPLFEKASIQLPLGKQFTVQTINNSAKNIYIQRIMLNGQPYTKSYLQHADLLKGGSMVITMGAAPNYTFGAAEASRP